MKKNLLKIVIGCCLSLIVANNSYAQLREQIFAGARPIGMGETFCAIVDDGNAINWNAAGLPGLKRFEFNSMYVPNLYGVGLRNGYLSIAWPLTQRIGIGASWLHLGLDDDDEVPLDFSRNLTNFSGGIRITDYVALSGSLKYFNMVIDDGGELGGKAGMVGYDLGGLLSLPITGNRWLQQINVGLTLYDIGNTQIRFTETSPPETIFPQQLRGGIAFLGSDNPALKWFTLKKPLVALDIDDRIHLGAETWINDFLAFRAGLQKDLYSNQDEGLTYSCGTSIRLFKFVQLDYAFNIPPVLPATHLFSFSFIRNPSPVKITKFELINDRVFASLYKFHNSEQMGNLEIINNFEDALEVTIKASVPELASTETTEKIVLKPKEIKQAKFSVKFSESILNINKIETHQIKIKLEYKIQNEYKCVEETKKFEIYGRGAITWDDPGKAAAFITKQDDPSISYFANEALRNYIYRSEIELGNVYKAARLFNALCLIGFEYWEDPNNPFPDFKKNQYQFDFVQYPAQSLWNKKGDCDELTVLYASLLEYAGIGTAFLTTDKHITLMFDSGIHERHWGVLPLEEKYVIRQRGTLWIPVNVVELDSSFAYAWQKGAEWKNENQVTTTFISDVEGIYQSAIPSDLKNLIPDSTTFTRLSNWRMMFTRDTTWIREKIAASIDSLRLKIKSNPQNIKMRNQLGIILAQQDSTSSAGSQFQAILELKPNHPQALTNLANTCFALGEFENAERNYLSAKQYMGNEPGLFLNLAIFYEIQSMDSPDSLKYQRLAEDYLNHAFRLLPGNEQTVLDLLGIGLENAEKAGYKEAKEWLRKKSDSIRKFIEDRVQKYLTQRTRKGERLRRTGVKRTKDSEQTYVLWWAI